MTDADMAAILPVLAIPKDLDWHVTSSKPADMAPQWSTQGLYDA